MRYYNLLTLALSFSLSTVAFLAAQPDDVPVQELEFDDYVIEGYIDVIKFDEHLVIAQAEPAVNLIMRLILSSFLGVSVGRKCGLQAN